MDVCKVLAKETNTLDTFKQKEFSLIKKKKKIFF